LQLAAVSTETTQTPCLPAEKIKNAASQKLLFIIEMYVFDKSNDKFEFDESLKGKASTHRCSSDFIIKH